MSTDTLSIDNNNMKRVKVTQKKHSIIQRHWKKTGVHVYQCFHIQTPYTCEQLWLYECVHIISNNIRREKNAKIFYLTIWVSIFMTKTDLVINLLTSNTIKSLIWFFSKFSLECLLKLCYILRATAYSNIFVLNFTISWYWFLWS